MTNVALGQGQAPAAIRMIEEGSKDGNWVFLANCHLMLSWMPVLEKARALSPNDTVQGTGVVHHESVHELPLSAFWIVVFLFKLRLWGVKNSNRFVGTNWRSLTCHM